MRITTEDDASSTRGSARSLLSARRRAPRDRVGDEGAAGALAGRLALGHNSELRAHLCSRYVLACSWRELREGRLPADLAAGRCVLSLLLGGRPSPCWQGDGVCGRPSGHVIASSRRLGGESLLGLAEKQWSLTLGQAWSVNRAPPASAKAVRSTVPMGWSGGQRISPVGRRSNSPSGLGWTLAVVGGSEAAADVVIDDADVLHECIHARRPDETVSL